MPGTLKRISEVLPPDWRVRFTMRTGGRIFSECWGERLPPPEGEAGAGRHRFSFLQWLDPVAAGSAGPVSYRACELVCSDDYAPLAYTVRSAGETATFRTDPGRVAVTLPTGQEIGAEIAVPDFLLDANMIAQLDLLLRLLPGEAAYRGRFLSPNALRTLDYTLEPAQGGFASSLGERIAVAPDGGIESVTVEGIEIARVPFEPPDWGARAGDMVADAPEPYSPPATIRLREFSFPGPDVTHRAALAAPVAPERAHAAAVFFAGSGRIDRHGYSGFLDLGTHQMLDALAERGVVSLRYDKRGAGETPMGSDTLEPSFEGVLADARAAIQALRDAPEAEGLPVFYIGHSQGGLVALAVAQDAPAPAGIVLLAAAGRPIDAVLADQIRDQARRLDLTDAALAERMADLDALFDRVRRGPPAPGETLPPKIEAQRHVLRWYHEQLAHDPADLIARAPAPVLVLSGGRDEQTFAADAAALVAAAETAGRDVTHVPLAPLDHLLKRHSGGGFADYTRQDRPVAAAAIDAVAEWIAARTRESGDVP